MYIKKVIEICVVREGRCTGCTYQGKTCTTAKKVLKVNKPLEYTINQSNMKGEPKNEGFRKED